MTVLEVIGLCALLWVLLVALVIVTMAATTATIRQWWESKTGSTISVEKWRREHE